MKQPVSGRAYALLALEGLADSQDRAVIVLEAAQSTGAQALCDALRDADVFVSGCAASAVAQCSSFGPGPAVETLLQKGALRQLVKLSGIGPSKDNVDRAIGYLIRNARAASDTDEPKKFFFAEELVEVLRLSPGLARDILDQIVNILHSSKEEQSNFALKGLGIIKDLLPSMDVMSTRQQLASINDFYKEKNIPLLQTGAKEPGAKGKALET